MLCESALIMDKDNENPDATLTGESLREAELYDLLVMGDHAEALRQAESWPVWPLDDIGLWLLVEVYFQSQRQECAPILERMLRNKGQRDELSVKRMEEMLEEAKAWACDRD
jgi:hypothetical protein